MRIAYNPTTAAALTAAPSNNDITFDLAGKAIYARGVKFEGTNTTYSVFKKHTSDNSGGYDGLVPVPSYTTTTIRYLREDGNWEVPIMSEAVTDLGTDGNYITWTKNGIVNTLTVPYATSAESLGGYNISNFMVYADHSEYVAASFTDENLSKKATEKYIEYWDSAGWFNSAWGQVTANYGFVGNLTGTATNASLLSNTTLSNSNGSIPKIINFPAYSYFGSSTDTYDYLKNIVKWIYDNANYGERTYLMGVGNPNSLGMMNIQLYGTSGKNGEGYPRYCSGTFLNLGDSAFEIFGTNNYNYYRYRLSVDGHSHRITKLHRRDASDDYSLQHHWTGSYWYLRGYYGDSYHAGVQVEYANNAGSATKDSAGNTISSYYLPLSGGTMTSTALILAYTKSKGSSDIYNGAILLREATGSATSCTDNMYDAPGITFHWSGKWVHKLNMHTDALYWDNNKLWHAGNDGHGSGLDADTVDNLHASAFAKIGTYNNLTHAGNEFTFASSAFSGGIWFNYRTASGSTDGDITTYHFGNGKGGSLASISNGYFSGTAASANSVTCTEASGDTPRPIVGVVNNSLYYTSKVTIRWDNGNVTAPTFTGRLIGSADQVDGYHISVVTSLPSTKVNNTIYILV